MILRDSKFRKELSFKEIVELARNARGKDEEGYCSEFINMVETTALLKK